jgi:hypothetical protein
VEHEQLLSSASAGAVPTTPIKPSATVSATTLDMTNFASIIRLLKLFIVTSSC